GEHASADWARRGGSTVAGRAPRGARARRLAGGAASSACRVPLRVRLGELERDPLVARAAGPATAPSSPRGRSGGPVVRARSLRPTPADRRARAGPRAGRLAGIDRRRRVSREAVVPRARRADTGRARVALAGASGGVRRDARGGRGCLGGVPRAGASRARGGGRRAASVPGRSTSAFARRAARSGGWAVSD